MYVERHPFDEFIPKSATALIVGSFPPVKLTVDDVENISGSNILDYIEYFERVKKSDCDLYFYYGSSENSFWELVGKSLDLKDKLDSVDKIKSFLQKYAIGITDIIQECCRKSATGGIGSLDSDLKKIKYRDVAGSIIDNNIKKVFCTSSFVKKKLDMQLRSMHEKPVVHILPSPSRSYYRSAWRLEGYDAPETGTKNYADEFRISKYRELLSC